ncbi:hypothetical protein SA496_21360 [Pseudomonas sp. JS3066]|uniref:hypothetical protein n=1 Tax=Pseudomonas sp. JS3066 TaxID=3090665 RepID=UPI002E7B72B0|nr:hypothetical protein [Pseudomonas sp. JS3066]WVK92250.1 hypothetical protein SA496_21360 [Pseudomonas sp. JS3066]
MQFEFTAIVIGVRRQSIEGRSFVNVMVAEETTDQERADGCSGLRVKKIPADDALIPQMPQGYKPMTPIKFLAVLKDAAGGKSQPHIIGVVPAKAGVQA